MLKGLCFAYSSILLFMILSRSNADDFSRFQSQELRCMIGNNTAWQNHKKGYNGIFQLTSIHQAETLFVPQYASLNLEHYFDASDRVKDRSILFEPRQSPMQFQKLDDRTAMLLQPPTSFWKVESTTLFRLVDPYYIDVTFRCTPQEEIFEGGALGVFWASYINSPLDKSIYFRRKEGDHLCWQQFCTQYHNHDSTIPHVDDSFVWTFSPSTPIHLFTQISPIRYAEPFYYGRFRNMVYIMLFKSPSGVRFSHSPSGGGLNDRSDDTCPAWDFQWIVPAPEKGKEYCFEYRIVYKKWKNRDSVLQEVKNYLNR